jgi:hypothetical protein
MKIFYSIKCFVSFGYNVGYTVDLYRNEYNSSFGLLSHVSDA